MYTQLKDVVHAELRSLLGNYCMSAAGLCIGTGVNTKIKIANTVYYAVDNVIKNLTTAEVAHSTVTVQSVSTDRVYLVCADATGTLSIIAGDEATVGEALIPDVTEGLCALGALLITTDATYTFTPGTSVAGTNNTATYYDLVRIPGGRILGGL
jgi:Flp pilus assembly protein TadG